MTKALFKVKEMVTKLNKKNKFAKELLKKKNK